MVEESERTHNQKVETVKGVLLGLNLPVLPLNTVRCEFYTPDIVTRLGPDRNGAGFIPIDLINTKERVAYDIGGLCLLYRKDIVARCVAIIADDLWDDNLRAFRLAKLNLPSKLTLIPMKDTEAFFANRAGLSPPVPSLAAPSDPTRSKPSRLDLRGGKMTTDITAKLLNRPNYPSLSWPSPGQPSLAHPDPARSNRASAAQSSPGQPSPPRSY